MAPRDIVPVIPVTIVSGRLVVDAARVRAVALALGDGDAELVIRRRRRRKTVGQNRLWRVIVDLVAEATGEDHDRTHYALLGRCFSYEWFRLSDGRVALLPRVGHSRPLTKAQMSHLLDWAMRWVPDPEHGLGIAIPETEEAFDDGTGDIASVAAADGEGGGAS